MDTYGLPLQTMLVADVFLSYSRVDKSRIEQLASMLEGANYTLWWDKHLLGGHQFSEDIEVAIAKAKAVLVVWSKDAVKSEWVRDEAAYGRDHKKLVAVRLDDTLPPMGFRQRHVIDLDDPDAMPALTAALDAFVGGSHEAKPVAPAKKKSTLPIVLGAAAAVAILTGGGYFATQQGVAPTSTEAAATEKSVAVLPFITRSTNEDDNVFADGMHDDLLTQLSKVSDMRVISRTSMAHYAGSDKTIPVIASELDVATVLEGTIQRAGDRIRINVQLIDGARDAPLWSESFDRELTAENLFDIQSEITRAIAAQLNAALSSGEQAQLADIPTDNIDAYNAYLRGKTLGRYQSLSPAKMRRAISAFEEAIGHDPDFVEAWGGKALAHLNLVWWSDDAAQNLREADRAIAQLADLAPDGVDYLLVQGVRAYWVDRDYAQAEDYFSRAAALAPNNTEIMQSRSAALRRAGKFEASIAQQRLLTQLDPNNAEPLADMVLTLAAIGDEEGSRRALERARAIEPDGAYVNLMGLRQPQSFGNREQLELGLDRMLQRPSTSDSETYSFDLFTTALHFDDPALIDRIKRALETAASTDPSPYSAPAIYLVALERLASDAPPDGRMAAMLANASRDSAVLDWLEIRVLMLAIAGEDEAARAEMAIAERRRGNDALWPMGRGSWRTLTHAFLGDGDAALAQIEEDMDALGPHMFARFTITPAMDPYRDDPRYKALERRYRDWRSEQR